MQDLRFSVEEILGRPGTYRDISVHHRLEGIGNALIRVDERAPTDAALRAESAIEGILVTGTARTAVSFSCARCLAADSSELVVEVCELFVAPGHEAPPEEETYEVSDKHIDLEPMLRDALSLALPMNPICGPDCKGLCARCGTNLNRSGCDCSDDEIDPRWAALSEIRNKL